MFCTNLHILSHVLAARNVGGSLDQVLQFRSASFESREDILPNQFGLSDNAFGRLAGCINPRCAGGLKPRGVRTDNGSIAVVADVL